ncbi:MAG: carboxymuconolactone decarboxylase family protein [Rhodospirillaceae bacterium]|nr:carboxymuconolactone decarboxylase family protein [Rhodospirillaceae bacterium]
MKPDTPFARVPRDKLPPALQRAWDSSQKIHGDATFIEVFGNAPHMLDWYLKDYYEKVFYSGRLDRKIVELVRLRLANIHGCAFCNRGDTIAALDAGVPQAQIDALDNYERGPFSEKEKAALALADVMVLTNPKGYVTRELYARARAHFTDGEMVELGVIMAVLCGMAKMIFAYDLVEKMDSCPFVPERVAAE